jgi:hypothetical protein
LTEIVDPPADEIGRGDDALRPLVHGDPEEGVRRPGSDSHLHSVQMTAVLAERRLAAQWAEQTSVVFHGRSADARQGVARPAPSHDPDPQSSAPVTSGAQHVARGLATAAREPADMKRDRASGSAAEYRRTRRNKIDRDKEH